MRYSRLLLLIGGLSGSLSTADVVVVATGIDGAGRSRLTGEILDFTGRELRLEQIGGREKTIPADRVVDIETTWSASHSRAIPLFENRQYDAALQAFVQAIGEEQRGWVDRRLFARSITCLRNLDQIERAGDAFLADLLTADPHTQYFDVIPLSWKPGQPQGSVERRALAWLEMPQNQPAQLMGASWLLPTANRGAAIETLRELSRSADKRVAFLAAAQLWRTQVVTAREQDVTQWKSQLARMPESLRAGPYYVLGRTLSRLKKPESAALTFMRVPILYPEHYELSADCLLATGRELERMNSRREAIGLYRRTMSEFANLMAAREAQSRLNQLTE